MHKDMRFRKKGKGVFLFADDALPVLSFSSELHDLASASFQKPLEAVQYETSFLDKL